MLTCVDTRTHGSEVNLSAFIFDLSVTYTEECMQPKYDPTGVRTHDLEIMNSACHVADKPSS